MHETTPTWLNWITVAAIVLGPVLALAAQRGLDSLREKRERRAQLYLTLMTTRATPLAPDHVNALNSIDVVFCNKRDDKVQEAWRKLLDHLNTDPERDEWQERARDLRADLLHEMGKRVGYSFSTDELKRGSYYPRFYGDAEGENLQIRQALATALTSDGLKVVVAGGEPHAGSSNPSQVGTK